MSYCSLGNVHASFRMTIVFLFMIGRGGVDKRFRQNLIIRRTTELEEVLFIKNRKPWFPLCKEINICPCPSRFTKQIEVEILACSLQKKVYSVDNKLMNITSRKCHRIQTKGKLSKGRTMINAILLYTYSLRARTMAVTRSPKFILKEKEKSCHHQPINFAMSIHPSIASILGIKPVLLT